MITLFKYTEKQKWHIRDGDWSLCGNLDYKTYPYKSFADKWEVEEIESHTNVICKRCVNISEAIAAKQRMLY